MKKLFIFLILIYHTSYIFANVSYNIANALLGFDCKRLLIVESKFSDPSDKNTKINLLGHSNYSTFVGKKFPVSKSCVVVLFQLRKDVDERIFIKEDFGYKRAKPVFLDVGSLWLILVESMYSDNGELNLDDTDKRYFSDIEKFDFINPKTFFKIPIPQNENVVCLSWSSDDNLVLNKNVKRSNLDFIEDIKNLSELHFKNETSDFLGLITTIDKILSKLKTDMGKQIAQKMIEILEKKIIDQEFKNMGDDKNTPLNLDAVRKLNKNK